MNGPFDAVIAGELYVDLILSGFEKWPGPGEESFARSMRREIGGGAAITAAGMASLGSRVSLLGLVGREDGGWVLERLRRLGVDSSLIESDPDEPTACTVAVSDNTDRAFFTYLGANRHFPQHLAAFVNKPHPARHIHLAFPVGQASACAGLQPRPQSTLEALRQNGWSISLDVGWHEAWLAHPQALDLISQIDVFFPNQPEAARITGETDPPRILERFRAAGAKIVALKLGPRGAALLWHGDVYHCRPWPANTIDTTGAGDCFDAGFLHFMLRGAPPELCLRAACICGAMSTEALGGIDGFPSSALLEANLEKFNKIELP